MDGPERIRRGYRAIGGLGVPPEVLAMFHQDEADPPEWVIEYGGRLIATREVVAMDLFAGRLPAQWEVIGVELRDWRIYEKNRKLIVSGVCRMRPRGAWDVMVLPFLHIWTVDDEVRAVIDYFGGIELLRLEDVHGGRWRVLAAQWLAAAAGIFAAPPGQLRAGRLP